PTGSEQRSEDITPTIMFVKGLLGRFCASDLVHKRRPYHRAPNALSARVEAPRKGKMSNGGKPAPDSATGAPTRSATARGSGRRLRGAIAHYLGTAIVSGRIAPGARLTGEVENAEALNVSRSAYREAVQVLTAKGLVASKPKDGTRVLPRSNWNLLDPMVLAWAFAGEPDPGFVRDLFELRAVVEPAVARLAAERRDKEDIRQMKKALAEMRRHTLAT